MYTSFADYAQTRRLATYIVENNLDVDYFCEAVLELAQADNLTESTILEAWFGVPQAARGVAGVGGGVAGVAGGMVKDAGKGIWAGMRGAGRGLAAAGRGIAHGLGAAASGVAQGVGSAASYVGNKYQQGSNAAVKGVAVKQVQDRLQALKGDLAALGLSSDQVTKMLAPIEQQTTSGQGAAPAAAGGAPGTPPPLPAGAPAAPPVQTGRPQIGKKSLPTFSRQAM